MKSFQKRVQDVPKPEDSSDNSDDVGMMIQGNWEQQNDILLTSELDSLGDEYEIQID